MHAIFFVLAMIACQQSSDSAPTVTDHQAAAKQTATVVDAASEHFDKLQGTWILISTRDMRRAGARLRQTFSFRHAEWILTTGDKITQAGTFEAAHNEGGCLAFDLHLRRGGNQTIRAIFEINDDILRYCGTWKKDRPQSFLTVPGDKNFFSVWKRADSLPSLKIPSHLIESSWREVGDLNAIPFID